MFYSLAPCWPAVCNYLLFSSLVGKEVGIRGDKGMRERDKLVLLSWWHLWFRDMALVLGAGSLRWFCKYFFMWVLCSPYNFSVKLPLLVPVATPHPLAAVSSGSSRQYYCWVSSSRQLQPSSFCDSSFAPGQSHKSQAHQTLPVQVLLLGLSPPFAVEVCYSQAPTFRIS